MKILMQQAAYFPWIGGAEIFAQKVAEHMVKKGHTVDVVTCIWEKPDVYTINWNKSFEEINDVGVYRTKAIHIRYIKTFSAILPMYKKSLNLHTKNKYNIIHSHIFPAMVSGAMLKEKIDIPLLTTVQGGDLADYKETTGRFKFFFKPLISWSLAKADIVHGVSTHTANRASQLEAKKTIVIPNGVDTQLFKPKPKEILRQQYGFSLKDKIIISNSRLTPKNGLDLLIRACSELSKTISNLKLLLIGDGEQRKELEKLRDKLNLNNTVIFYGYKNNEELVDYLNLSDVFCRPSYDEGFGIAFIEAMACKVPVIGTKIGGITDIIENGTNGIMVASGNLEELTQKLELLLTKNEIKQQLIDRGYKTIEEKFAWDLILKKMENLYKIYAK